MPEGLEYFAPFVALAVISTLAVFIIKRIKKHEAERARALQEFGFIECKPVDPTVAETIVNLTAARASRTNVKSLYRRQQGAFDLYLAAFDRAEDSESSESDTIVIISPNASLPRFTVTPHVPGTGRMSALANSLLSQFARRPGFKDVAVSPGSEFDRRYGLLAPDGESVLSQLHADIWERLAALPQLLSIDAGGDTVTFSVLLQNARSTRYNFENLREYIRTHTELAEQIHEIFARNRVYQTSASTRYSTSRLVTP